MRKHLLNLPRWVSWSVCWSVTLSDFLCVCDTDSVSLDRYRVSVDHEISYVFWKLWQLSIVYFCEVYPAYASSKLCKFISSSAIEIENDKKKTGEPKMLCLHLEFASLRSTCTVAPVGTRLKVGEGGGRGEKSPDSFEKKVLLSLTCGCQDERQPGKLAHALFWNCKSSLRIKQHLLLN